MAYKTSKFPHPSGGAPILVLGEYRPWNHHKASGGTASNWDEHSSRIMDVKQRRPNGYEYFARGLLTVIAQTSADAVAIVPGHDPAKLQSGLRAIVENIAGRARVLAGTDYLKRTELIEKLAGGGDRAMKVHLDSIVAYEPARFRGKTILLIDDVLTSGNSMAACRQILISAGAHNVPALALSQTTY